MMNVCVTSALRRFSLAIAALAAISPALAQITPPLPPTTTVNLTAQRMSLALPDGNTAPMWGFCSTPAAPATACSGPWGQGPTITVPTGQSLTINLTNNLPTPTSIVILGQLGAGLGTPVMVPSPGHAPKSTTTWPTNTGATFTPPGQGNRVQSFGSETAGLGGTNTYKWASLNPGTYLYETGTHPSIQAPMGLYGVIVVTQAPIVNSGVLTPGVAYSPAPPALPVSYDSDAVMLMSEIDLGQNTAVDALAASAGTGLIDPKAYPPAVNYSPTYFLMNGQPFSRSAPSAITIPAGVVTGKVLLRFANAGLRTHVPSVVGLNMSLIAEDGNVLPGNPKIQSEVNLPAGKTYDVLVSPPTVVASSVTTFAPNTYGVFDRQLSLSAGNTPDSGIQTFLQVAGANLPSAAIPTAIADAFSVQPNSTFTGNVLLNDIAVYSAAIQNLPTMTVIDPTGANPPSQASAGTVTIALDGTFVFTPVAGATYPVTFSYCGNGSSTVCAPVTLTAAGNSARNPTAIAQNYSSNVATYFHLSRPGVLKGAVDPSGYTLQAIADPANPLPSTVTLNKDGSFIAVGGVQSFNYLVVNSQGMTSLTAPVSIAYAAPTGLKVAVTDPNTKATLSDYRWTIEEDTTYKNDAAVNTGTPPSTLAVNFHKSYMPVVAVGCTGPQSCGSGQTYNGVTGPTAPIVMPGDVYLDPNKHYYISILPGDGANAFVSGTQPANCTADLCGHSMGGAVIDPGALSVTALVEPNPLPTSQLSIYIFEDNNPTNGDIDGPEESQGLGGFQIILNDVAGKTGDPIGQMTYDAFNMPLTNALMGTPDCPAPSAANGKDPSLQGMVLTCPAGSKLAGHALIKNLMPGRFDVIANPGAGRQQAGEHWVQVSTLEGTRGQDAFTGVGEPAYFQEFGPPGFHSFIGFVNTDKLEQRHAQVTAAAAAAGLGTHTVTGTIANEHMSRPTNESLYTGSHDPLAHTTCYVGLNSNAGNGENIAFSRCKPDGTFSIAGVPDGSYQLVAWDEWLDQIIGYQQIIVKGADYAMGPIQTFTWFTRVETHTFLDNDGTHKPSAKNDGISQVPTTIRFRDGSFSNKLQTDASGTATFDELFPLFNWYVAESDQTRFKSNKVHVVVDGGGAPDTTGDYAGILTSKYPTGESTERFDDKSVQYEGLQGFISQTQILDWAKVPYNVGENGGISGTVVYYSTRPFDDPRLDVQNLWEPLVPRVPVNLYQETTAPDGTVGFKLVNSTTTSSWDDFVNTIDPVTGKPAMKCPGQIANGAYPGGDPFVGSALGVGNEQRCYDGFHNWNQVQPAAYDGRYLFTTDSNGNPLPIGKYQVEVVVPPGYTLVKEEDKNILIGDAFIAPASQQFGTLSNIFILPDQAVVGQYNNNPNNPSGNNDTTDLGHPNNNLNYPACVGAPHLVPDYLSLFPGAAQVAPFAGAVRPLCDRKEVFITDQQQSNADFFIYTEAHIASHFTGIILDDASAEFNTASPDFGEKASVPYVPVSIRDWKGYELSRLHSDQYGTFNGLTPSSWEVNVPNPAGYSPNMLTTCMNDPGPILNASGVLVTDPAYNPNYSIFCYDNPFMPGLTDYLDTPLLPVAAFAAGYNPADCTYVDTTPAIRSVATSAFAGPWLAAGTGTTMVTLTSVGISTVPNPNYAGPSATSSPANQKTITKNFGFGAIAGQVLLGGKPLVVPSGNWTDSTITAIVPAGAVTGELSVVAANGKSSIDGVTLTIETAQPTLVTPTTAGGDIQKALDAANPGDLIILGAGTYNELAIMSKPVRLQGVGAPSVIINATKYPTSKLQNWRPKINTLFGIDAAGNQTLPALVDPLPGQEITGGIVLLEPSVLGTEEGPGITVLAKNLGTVSGLNCSTNVGGTVVYNFACYPSRIDGLSVTGGDSGGGIFVNGWAHNLEISNNRIYGNAGAYNGGVRIGIPYLEGLGLTGRVGGFAFNKNVNIHNNGITSNGTVEANTGEAGAGGGLSLSTGTDGYQVTKNFVCGNFTVGDGGGIGHIGVSLNGLIQNNVIQFNQSYAQGATVHGGGIAVEGEPAAAGGALSLGTGDVTIDSNLIQGNFAEVGNGGGIRLAQVNGAEIAQNKLYQITVTNNIVTNNVAGTAGGGISLADAINTNIVENTISSNDSVSIAGALFNVTPLTSSPHPAGVVTEPTSQALIAAARRTNLNAAHKAISNPDLNNNIIWQNRSFYFDGNNPTTPGDLTCSSNNQADATAHKCNQLPAQTTSGACVGTPAYWDLGVMGDTSSTPGTARLLPTNSIISDANYTGTGSTNVAADPALAAQYCNGGRGAPTALHVFQLAASAVEDEGGNFVDLRYGPLTPTGDYRITLNSPAVDAGSADASNHDFFGTRRPVGAGYDIGAHELLPALTLTPSALNFGKVQFGQTATLTTVLANTGNLAATLGAINFGGAPAQYSQTNNCPASLAGGANCTITIVLSPTAAQGVGLRAATLYVHFYRQTITASLTGNAVAPSGTVAPTSLAFGNVQLGQTSAAQTVTLSNTGVGPLTVGAINFGGASAGFSQSNNCVSPIGVGASCAISVVFAPTGAAGARTATLSVNTGAGVLTVTPITGTAVAAMGTFTPASLAFGSMQVGQTSASQTATLKNTGIGPLTINATTFPGGAAGFSQTNNCPTSLAANATCTFTVTFAPTGAAGARTATLSVATSGGAVTVNLSGTAVASTATFSPTSLAFGNVQVGQTSAGKTATLTNTGIGTLSIGATTFPGGAAGFSQTNNCPTSLAANATCTFTVTFTPTGAAGGRSATLSVATGAGAITVGLTGTATAPAASVNPTSLTFASTPRGTRSASKAVTLTNSGSGPLTLGLTVTGQYSLATPPPTGACGATLAFGQTCTINVVFAPTTGGTLATRTGTVSVNYGGAAPLSISLSGTPN